MTAECVVVWGVQSLDGDSSLSNFILFACLFLFMVARLFQGAFTVARQDDKRWSEGQVRYLGLQTLIAQRARVSVFLLLLPMAAIFGIGFSLFGYLGEAESTWTLNIVIAFLVIALGQDVVHVAGERYSVRVMIIGSPVLVLAYWIFKPLLWTLEYLTNFAQNARRENSFIGATGHPQILEEDMSSLPIEQELLEADPDERRMIRAILNLEEISAREIMVPRVDIIAVEDDAPVKDVITLMADSGHSRILIYRETIDNVIGIVHARDVLQGMVSTNQKVQLHDIVRSALFIPENKNLDDLLREFQDQSVTIAVVVDEYGGTEGLVTIEDLLEEIVGEIEDEFAIIDPPIVFVNDEEAVLDGRVALDEVNQIFHTSLEAGGFGTLAGFISNQLGKIPAMGDIVDIEGVTMVVISTIGRRVLKVRVKKVR
jgi:putative hemolysin